MWVHTPCMEENPVIPPSSFAVDTLAFCRSPEVTGGHLQAPTRGFLKHLEAILKDI